MARRGAERQRIEALLRSFHAEIRAAFIEVVDDLRANVDFAALVRALEAGDVQAAIEACHVDGAAYWRLRKALETVYIEAGTDAVAALPALRDWKGAKVAIRFDPAYHRAADWTARHGAGLVQVFVDDQRAAIRDVVEASLRAGTDPRKVAVHIAGPVSRVTGRREGGILGLTQQQALFVNNPKWKADQENEPPGARQQLESGDPELMRGYLSRQARDRRFDPSVRKAIKAGTSLDAEAVSKAMTGYSNGLLKVRADTVARTESTQATSAARQEAMRQTLDAAGLSETDVERTWRAVHDHRTRDSHRQMDGQAVIGMETAFTSPSGASLRYPGDPDAPASETIQCRCFVSLRLIRRASED